MSKYIITIKSEYEDSFKGLMILGAKDSNLFVDTLAVDDLEQLNSDYINEHFGSLQDDAYNKGYAQCQDDYSDALKHAKDTAYKKGLHDGESKCGYCTEYQRGLDDAWEVARKIAQQWEEDTDIEHRLVIDDSIRVTLDSMTASEAIEKLKAYEEKQTDKIEVGDIVNLKDGSRDNDGIVTKSWDNDRHFIMWADGSGGVWDKEYIVKTGRHLDIDKILEGLRYDG